MPVQYEVYNSIGSSTQSQLARRVGEEVWFKRNLERDPVYGYKQGKWRETSERPYLRENGDNPASYSETASGWVKPSHPASTKIRLPRL